MNRNCAVQVLNDIGNVTAGKSNNFQGEEDEVRHDVNKPEEEDELGVVLNNVHDVMRRDKDLLTVNEGGSLHFKENMGLPPFVQDKANEHLDLDSNEESLVEAGGNGWDTAITLEVTNSGKRNTFPGVSESIKDLVVMTETNSFDAEFNGSWRHLSPKKTGMAKSLGSPNKALVFSEVEPSYVATMTSGKEDVKGATNKMKAGDDKDGDETAENIISKSLTEIVVNLNSNLTNFTLDNATSGGEATLNKHQHMVETEVNFESSTSESIGVDVSNKVQSKALLYSDKEGNPKLVTTVAIQSPPALLTFIRFQAPSATLVTKHVRGYLARLKVARMIHGVRFTSVARDAASAACVRNKLIDFGEPTQLSVLQLGSSGLFDLSYDGTEESCYNNSFSMSSIQDDADSGEELALEGINTSCMNTNSSLKSRAGLSNQLLTAAGFTNELTLEMMKSFVLSSAEEEGVDELANEDHESDGETDFTTKGFNLAGINTEVNSESSSPNLFEDNEISESCLFENCSFNSVNLPTKVSGSTVACRPKDDVAFFWSKSDSLQSDVPESIEIKSKEQESPQHIHAPGNSTSEYDTDETDDGTIVYLGTVQADADKTRGDKSKARADEIVELEAILKELQQNIDLAQQNQLLERKLLESKHLESGEITMLKGKHNASRSLFHRQLSILKAKYSTMLSEKLAAEAKLKYLHEKNSQFSAQVLMLKGENEILVFQKLAAEAKTEWVKKNLAVAGFGWIQFLLLLLVLSM